MHLAGFLRKQHWRQTIQIRGINSAPATIMPAITGHLCASCQSQARMSFLSREREGLITCNGFSTSKYSSCGQGQSHVWLEEEPFRSTIQKRVRSLKRKGLDSTHNASLTVRTVYVEVVSPRVFKRKVSGAKEKRERVGGTGPEAIL